MDVHLIDGTYELFRYHHAPNNDDPERGAVRGVLGSMVWLLERGGPRRRAATHVGVATDHVIESFRNDLWPGYKSSAGMPPELMAQFHPLEDALRALGLQVWAMTDVEADDALATAASVAADDPRVDQVIIATPDKDLGQCVRGDKVIQWDRMRNNVRDADGVFDKFGVPPAAIADWLALVGDAADGFPGLPGFGAKTAATLLQRFGRIEDIPDDPASWGKVRSSARLAQTLRDQRAEAMLFKRLATLVEDAQIDSSVDAMEWTGPTDALPGILEAFHAQDLLPRIEALQAGGDTASSAEVAL